MCIGVPAKRGQTQKQAQSSVGVEKEKKAILKHEHRGAYAGGRKHKLGDSTGSSIEPLESQWRAFFLTVVFLVIELNTVVFLQLFFGN